MPIPRKVDRCDKNYIFRETLIIYKARHQQKHEVVNMILKLSKFKPNYLLITYPIIEIRFNDVCFSILYYF
jgi:hypothetical protein